ncbi:MAG: hypothetical protein RI990_614 [Planctomycetota bacterium]
MGPTARTRCPRCAYALTGLPGAPDPASPYDATTKPLRCPECALEIPLGSHCLVGGATPAVVDPSGSRGVLAVVLGGLVLIGGPWLCIVGVTALVEYLKAGAPKRGIAPSALQGFAIGALPAAIGLGVAAWFMWRQWRRADPGRIDGERAGARLRRAMVVPGGVHLWSGEPSVQSRPRSLAGGDIRDVRGRRHVPLFRRAGVGEAGAIDLITPIVLWSMNDAKHAANLADGRFAGTVWLLMPRGSRPEPVANAIERTLRAAPGSAPVQVESSTVQPVPTPLVDGDPNRLAVPVAITAATAAERPVCPRCGHGYGEVPDGCWWEPLPRAVTCSECGLDVPEGAIVVVGNPFGRQGGQRLSSRARWVVAGAAVGGTALIVVSIVIIRQVSTWAGLVVQVAATIAMPLAITFAIRSGMRPVPRARARFQAGNEAWSFERGRLRIITRGRSDGRVIEVPARRISRVTFGRSFAADNSIPMQTDALTVGGTAEQLGIMGERTLYVALPAEADQDVVVERAQAALRSEIGPG